MAGASCSAGTRRGGWGSGASRRSPPGGPPPPPPAPPGRTRPARGLGLGRFVALLARRRTITYLRTRRQNPWSEESTAHDALDLHPDATSGPESTALRREAMAALSARLRTRVSARGARLFELL